VLDRGLLFAQAGLCVALRVHGALLFDIMAALHLRRQAGSCMNCNAQVADGRWSSYYWHLTTKYADAFEKGTKSRLEFENAQRLVPYNKVEPGINLFCRTCSVLHKFSDPDLVVSFFKEKAKATREPTQPAEPEEPPAEPEAPPAQAEVPAVAGNVALRLQNIEQILTALLAEVKVLRRLAGDSEAAGPPAQVREHQDEPLG